MDFENATCSELRIDRRTGFVTVFFINPRSMEDSFTKVVDVLKAIDAGFDRNRALLLMERDQYFARFPLKETKSERGRSKKRTAKYAGRIVGKKGMVLRTIESRSGVRLAVTNNSVAIIGHHNGIRGVVRVLTWLIDGRTLNFVIRAMDGMDFSQDRLELPAIKAEVEILQEIEQVVPENAFQRSRYTS